MKNKFIFILCLLVSFTSSVKSEDERIQSGFYITPKLALTTAQDQSEEMIGYGLDFGYQITPSFRSELGLIDFGQVSGDHFIASEVSLIGLYPVSDFANLFLGVGIGYANNDYSPTSISKKMHENYYPTVNLGVEYFINNNLSLISKYHTLLEPKGLDNVYTFELGLKYAFGSNKRNHNSQVFTPVADKKTPLLPKTATFVPKIDTEFLPVVKKEEQAVEKKKKQVKLPVCFMQREITKYTVKRNDYLHKIARVHNMTFQDLKRLNLMYFPGEKRDPNIIYVGEVIVVNTKNKGSKKCEL